MSQKVCSIAVPAAAKGGRNAKWAKARIEETFNLQGGVLRKDGKRMKENKVITEHGNFSYEGGNRQPLKVLGDVFKSWSEYARHVHNVEAAFSAVTGVVRKRLKLDRGESYSEHVRIDLSRSDLVSNVPRGTGASVLSAEEVAAARAAMGVDPSHQQDRLAAFMTPIFAERLMPAFPPTFALVNCADNPWMPPLSARGSLYTTPDHLIAPHYLVKYLPPPEDAPHVANGEYGTFPVIDTARSIGAVGEAHARLDSAEESDMMTFLERLSEYGGYSAEVRGFAYDCDKCTLITAINGHILQVTSFAWTTPGTRALMTNYFSKAERVWDDAIAAACAGLGVELLRFSSADLQGNASAQCILGSGASARVLRARRLAGTGDQDEERAVKVVCGRKDCTELSNEFMLLSELPNAAAPFVVGACSSMWMGTVPILHCRPLLAAAFLLPIIGEPFTSVQEVTNDHGLRILESLSDLHWSGVVHNDAHFTNVVRVPTPTGTSYRWIGLRAPSGDSKDYAADVVAFLHSVGRAPQAELLENYAIGVTERWGWGDEKERHASV